MLLQVIYVARNPRDVVVSYYYLNKLYRTQGYVNTFEKYWDYFEKNLSKSFEYLLILSEIYQTDICNQIRGCHTGVI